MRLLHFHFRNQNRLLKGSGAKRDVCPRFLGEYRCKVIGCPGAVGAYVWSAGCIVQQFRRPHIMYEEPHKGLDMMMLGMIGESTQNRDQFITKQVSRHLFSEQPPHEPGEDLMSLNMQRGRDHGIPGNNTRIQVCIYVQVLQYSFSVSPYSIAYFVTVVLLSDFILILLFFFVLISLRISLYFVFQCGYHFDWAS